MKPLVIILALFLASNATAAGRINPFNGQPITYSLSEKVARDAMGSGAYDRMRVQTWQNRKALNNPMEFSRGHNGQHEHDLIRESGVRQAPNDYSMYAEDQQKVQPTHPLAYINYQVFKHGFKIKLR